MTTDFRNPEAIERPVQIIFPQKFLWLYEKSMLWVASLEAICPLLSPLEVSFSLHFNHMSSLGWFRFLHWGCVCVFVLFLFWTECYFTLTHVKPYKFDLKTVLQVSWTCSESSITVGQLTELKENLSQAGTKPTTYVEMSHLRTYPIRYLLTALSYAPYLPWNPML